MKYSRIAGIFAVLIVSSVLAGGVVTAQANHDDHGQNAPDCPEPGFVSGVVQDVTPDFLKNLIDDLPVPSVVERFFGVSNDC